jgi:hypothetical protein
MNPLDLSPAEFQDFLTEERQYRSPEQIGDLIRRYNAANSLSGRLAGLLEPQEGRRRTSILPASVPEGMSLFDALKAGEAKFAVPQGVVDMVTGTVRGVENPALAAQGRIPASDMNAAGFETAAAAMGLGGLLATKPAGSLGANVGRSKPSVEEIRRQANIDRFGYDPNEEQAVDTSYRISHQPSGPKDENPIRLDDLTKTVTGETAGYPEDFYGNQGARIYAPPRSFADDEYGISNEESYDVIRNVRNNPDAEVTIYRAVPDSDDINTINEGDWITLSPKYAEVHAASGYGRSGDEAGKVISKKVKVKDIYWAGDDVNEFGYFPDTTAANASKTVGFFGMFGGNEIKPKPEVQSLFSEDVYHYMKSPQMEGDVIDTKRSTGRLDRLGPHVGTAQAAEDRYSQFYSIHPEMVDQYLSDFNETTGVTLPLKARLDRPFLNREGEPFQESELLDVMNNYADENKISDLDLAADQFRKDLTDAGYTNVPYVNAIEDRGNISHIMLTGRTAGDPEVLRSRFARFQDPYDESIMAANASALGGLLSQSLSEKQANKIEDYLYRTGLLQ